jgi:copper chaperone
MGPNHSNFLEIVGMTTREFKINGMTCNHCVMAVKKELARVPGLQVQDVTIGSAKVTYDEREIPVEHITAAIAHGGYSTVP